MKTKIEFLIPVLYSVNREIYRFNLSKIDGLIRPISSMIRNYLWLPIYALIILNKFEDISVYYNIFIYIITFMVLYEIGYIIADNIGIRFEKKEIRRDFYKKQIPLSVVGTAVFLRLITVGILFKIHENLFYKEIVLLYFFTLLIFIVHSLLRDSYRVGTFIMLRIMKGFVPYAFLLFQMPLEENLLVFSGLIGIALYYSTEYSVRKLGETLPINIYSEKFSFLKFLFIFILASIISVFYRISVEKILIFFTVFAICHIVILFLSEVKKKIVLIRISHIVSVSKKDLKILITKNGRTK